MIAGDCFTWQSVKLNCDVVINEGNAADWATNPPTYTWQPIGGNVGTNAGKWYGFDGEFDGQGHTISGMYTSSTLAQDLYGAGVFGIMGYEVNASVSNLIVENFYQECTYGASGLIGRTKHAVAVENCVVRNGYVVSHKDQSAALIGGAYGGDATIINSGVDNVSIKGRDYIGGMVGVSNGYTVSITDSYFIGSIECEYQLGVMVGRKKDGRIALKNVYAIAEGTEHATSANASNMGCGVVYGVNADNSVVTIAAQNYFYVQNLNAASGEVKDIGTTGTAAVTLTHLTGEMAKATLNGFDFDTVWKTVDGGTPIIELRGDNTTGGDENNNSNNNSNNNQQGGSNNEATTTKPATTTEEKEPSTKAPGTDATADEAKDGKSCGSVVGFSGVMLTAVLAGAAIMLKKED